MENRNDSRRSFIKKAAIGSMMTLSIPEIVSAAMPAPKKMALSKGNVILFQGDSITDAGRSREHNQFNSKSVRGMGYGILASTAMLEKYYIYNNPRALGTGYAMLAAAALLEKYPELNLKIFNKGISGNKVFQLAERWDDDCINIKPDVLSILIGVNDIWHKLNGQYNGTVEIYRKDYIALLERTKKALPDVKLIICEPYAVKGVKAVDEKWYPEFYEYQKAARDIALQFGAIFVPFQKVYDEAQKRAPGSYWTPDGVHASFAGAQMMAKAWLEAIK